MMCQSLSNNNNLGLGGFNFKASRRDHDVDPSSPCQNMIEPILIVLNEYRSIH
jgi:hypothetical protein